MRPVRLTPDQAKRWQLLEPRARRAPRGRSASEAAELPPAAWQLVASAPSARDAIHAALTRRPDLWRYDLELEWVQKAGMWRVRAPL
jgi:hypothetical protein